MFDLPAVDGMKELTLRRFFEGHATASELGREASASVKRSVDGNGARFGEHRITEMIEEFTIMPAHLIRLVDAILAGELSLDALDAVTFCLDASNRFMWNADEEDGDRIANALFWLGTPEINYPLTASVLKSIRHYVLTGENLLTKADTR